MKTILKTLFIATIFILSCNKRDRPAAHSWVVLSKYSLTESLSEGKDTILVSSNIDIKLNVLPAYLKASIVSAGEQQYKIILSFTANTDTSIRNYTINISGKNDSILPVPVKFIQAGSSPFIFINNNTRAEDPEGQLDSVIIFSNVSWNLDLPQNANWITPSRVNSGPGTSKVFFTIDTNKVIQPRTASLSISNPDGLVAPLSLNISQDIDYHISDINPLSGTPGNVVTIKGIFGPDPVVKLNGVTAVVNADTETEISFMLPANASTGKITVSFGNRTITSKQDFTYYNYYITDFSPRYGTPGTNVVINGSFGPNLKLKLNGQNVRIDIYTPSQISFTVPADATTGKLAITSGAYTITSINDFIVTEHNTWIKIADSHGGFYQLGVSFASGDFIYSGLGYSVPNGSNVNRDFRIFNTKTHQWKQGPHIPENMTAAGQASCFELNGKVYIGFGLKTNIMLSDWWSFDPTLPNNTTWKKLTSFETIGFNGIAFVIANKAYSGIPYWDNGNLDVFNPTDNMSSGSWTPVATVPKVAGSASIVINNLAYIIGGNAGSIFYKFNPIDNSITSLRPAPVFFDVASTFSLNGYGYILDNAGRTDQYDPKTDSWAIINAQSPNISGVYNAKVVNGIAYAWTSDGTMYQFIP